MNDAKRAFDELALRCAEPFGFMRRTSLTYTRSAGTIEAFLLFGLRKDQRGYFAVTGSIGLRLSELDPLVEGSPTNGIHINVPLHLLGENRTFREWQFSNTVEVADLATEITNMLANRVIPFLKTNGNLEDVRSHLSSTAPKDWYVLTPENRTTLLAAIQWTLGDKTEALATIDCALSKLVNALPKKRVALDSLRSKLST